MAARSLVKVPDRIGHGLVMGVDQQVPPLAVASEMDLANPVRGEPGDVGVGVKPVVRPANVDVVDVDEQIAARASAHLGDELVLGHRVVCERQIV